MMIKEQLQDDSEEYEEDEEEVKTNYQDNNSGSR